MNEGDLKWLEIQCKEGEVKDSQARVLEGKEITKGWKRKEEEKKKVRGGCRNRPASGAGVPSRVHPPRHFSPYLF